MAGPILFLIGLVVLIVGAELVVRGASRLALSLGVSPLILGLTVVSVATSAPELAVGITATIEGAPAIAVANIAGTNVVNILFILGLAAVMRPVPIHRRILKLELPVMVGAAALMLALSLDGVLTTLEGIVLVVAGAVYTFVVVRTSRRERRASQREFAEMYGEDGARTEPIGRGRAWYSAMLAVGIGLSLYGADLLVSGAVDIARALNVSNAIIGLTIVAIGTSAPELATAIVGTLRNERDVAVGNLIGSSVYNICFILGMTTVIIPGDLPVDRQLLMFDIPLMAAVAVLCVPVFVSGRHVSRLEGAAFVAMYGVYLGSLILLRA